MSDSKIESIIRSLNNFPSNEIIEELNTLDQTSLLSIVKRRPFNLHYIKDENQTLDTVLYALEYGPPFLIDRISPIYIKEAIEYLEKNEFTLNYAKKLQFIINNDKEYLKRLIKEEKAFDWLDSNCPVGYEFAIKFIDQDDELCELAVQNDNVLKYVKNQTLKICELAVKKNYWSMIYVKNQTYELCRTCIKYNWMCFPFVKNKNRCLLFYAIINYCRDKERREDFNPNCFSKYNIEVYMVYSKNCKYILPKMKG